MSFENPTDDEILIAVTQQEAGLYPQFKRHQVATTGSSDGLEGVRFKTAYYTGNAAARPVSDKFWPIMFLNGLKREAVYVPILTSWPTTIADIGPVGPEDVLIVGSRQESLLYPGFSAGRIFYPQGELDPAFTFANAYYTNSSVPEGTLKFWHSFARVARKCQGLVWALEKPSVQLQVHASLMTFTKGRYIPNPREVELAAQKEFAGFM